MYTIKEIEFQEWEQQWQKCQNVNLLQSWQYGEAKQNVENWTAYHYIILDENNDEIALTQILLKRMPILGSIARINRGPIIIGQNEEIQDQEFKTLNAIEALIAESRNKGWRMLQIAPELKNTESAINQLTNLGLHRLSTSPWESGLLSLDASEEELLMRLNGKWRNCLRKGWKSKVVIRRSELNMENIENFLYSYSIFKKSKKFTGISEDMLKALALQSGKKWKFYLLIANNEQNKEELGNLVSIHHGSTATYLIGNTKSLGRKYNANYVLLWTAIKNAKNEGCKWFDIGGLDSTTPHGIAHFKKGLKAAPYFLVGEWRKFFFPSLNFYS